MYRRLLVLATSIFFFHNSHGQVWSSDVAPILYNNCVSCHRAGGIAPMSLMTYSDAVTSATVMSAAVGSKRMPPWPPDPNYKRLAHERLLTQTEINTITSWVANGTQQGNPNLAPPQPVFNANGDLPGTPNLIAKIPAYTSQASTDDVYRCFVVPSGISTQKFITAFEAIPGNRGIVHHVLVYADTSGTCAALDAADPLPGYTSFGGVGTNDAIMLGGWVPGTAPIQFPTGFGVELPANSDIVIQIHYPRQTVGMEDSTEVHFFFSPTNSVRNVFIKPVLNHFDNMTNGPLAIAANQTKTFTEKYDVPVFLDASILGVAPHMHLIGKNISCFGVSPANDTQNFIRINNWDFHWQGFYMFPRLQKVKGGSSIYATAFYDNTSNNVRNPNNPPQNVFAGESTTDEMMLVYFLYTLYQPGDENIVIDSNAILSVPYTYYRGQQILELFPNPANSNVIVKCYLENQNSASIDLVGIDGKLVKTLQVYTPMQQGYKAYNFNVSDVPGGIYQVRLKTNEQVTVQKLLIRH